MRAQVCPLSVGRVLLDHDRLDLLWDAEAFDALRLGCTGVGITSAGSRFKTCKLCGVRVQGLAHILAECEFLREERRRFLTSCGGKWDAILQGAPAGDWPAAKRFKVRARVQQVEHKVKGPRWMSLCVAAYRDASI